MRVLQVMLSRGWGGGERNAFDMAVHLAMTNGVEVCFAVREGSVAAERLRSAHTGVELATVPHLGTWDWRTRRSLLALCQRFRPDVVHTHFNRASAMVGGLVNSFSAGYVASLHGKYPSKHYRRIGHIVVATQALADYAGEHFESGVAVHRLPLAVPAPDSTVIRKPHDGFVIGAIGRLHPVKGYDFLIQAFAQLYESKPARDVRLTIAGAGPALKALKGQAARLNVDPYVAFPGWTDNVADFFTGIDLLVIPSRSESFGLTILEAAPFGIPIVATDTDGPRELLLPNQLVPFGNVDRLAEIIVAAMNDPDRFTGPASQKMEDYVQALLRIYRIAAPAVP